MYAVGSQTRIDESDRPLRRKDETMSDTWKVILGVVLALILFPTIWKVVGTVLAISFGLIQLAIVAAVIIFIIGLVRRMNRV